MLRCHGDALAGVVLSSTKPRSRQMPCCGLYGLPLAKSAFTSIEPKSQSGSTRTSFQASSSARALFSLDVAIPSAATALAVAPSLMVIARVEPPTPDGPQSNNADSGLWMIPLQNAGLLEIREITTCLSGGSADGENR